MTWKTGGAIVRAAAERLALIWKAAERRRGCADLAEAVEAAVEALRELGAEPGGMGAVMATLWQDRLQDREGAAFRERTLDTSVGILSAAVWQATAIGNEVVRLEGGCRDERWGSNASTGLHGMLEILGGLAQLLGVGVEALDAARAEPAEKS